MKETFFFFKSGNFNLFGTICFANSDKAVIFCSPFGEEKVRTYRVFRNFAVLLAQNGYTSFRFDYMGEGDSDGEFEEATITTRLKNIADAIEFLKTQIIVKEITLLGLRFGGTLALLAASRFKDVQNIILWQPIVDCKRYFYDLLRSNLTLQMRAYKKVIYNRSQLIEKMMQGETVNVEGYLWTWEFYKEAISIDLFNESKKYFGNSLIVQISQSNELEEQFIRLHQTLNENGARHTILHLPKEFLWEHLRFYNPNPYKLFTKTLEWLKGNERDSTF